MTRREQRVLDHVRTTIERTGVAPTISEIADGMGLAGRGSIHQAVDGLVKAGHLVRTAHRERGLRLPDLPSLLSFRTEALRAELARRGEAA